MPSTKRSCLDLKNSDGEESAVLDLISVFVSALSDRWKRHLILTDICLYVFIFFCLFCGSNNIIITLGGPWLLLVSFRLCHTTLSSLSQFSKIAHPILVICPAFLGWRLTVSCITIQFWVQEDAIYWEIQKNVEFPVSIICYVTILSSVTFYNSDFIFSLKLHS